MSGRKRIYVDQGEWNRLRAEAGKLTELRRDLPALIDQVRAQTGRDLERTFGEFDSRQRSVEQSLEGMSDQARRFEQQTTQRLRENSRRLRQALDDNTRNLRAETGQLLREQREALQQAITEERRDRQHQLAQLTQGIDALQRDQARAAEIAEGYLADARQLCAALRELPHERFAPGELAALERRLSTAESNRQDRLGAFGLSGAQSLYHDLSDLRVKLELADLEWRLCRSAAEQALRVVEDLIRQNHVLTLTAADGQAVRDNKPDVDYWSRGALSRLREEVTVLLDRLHDEQAPMSVQELQTVVDRTAPELEQRLDTIVRQAGTAVFASQLRTNFADLIAEALETNHQYEVTESCFAGADQRDTFYAKSTHLNGNEVVIEVEPTADDKPDCIVRVLSYDDDTLSEEERAARARSITRSMRDRGIEAGEAVDEGGAPDPAKQDLKAIGQPVRQPQSSPVSSAGRSAESGQS